jgi:uncharacterized membrane protein
MGQYSVDMQAFIRWAHFVAGVLWIGHLYFFNFVNAPFAATLDKDTKPRVIPELAPRALFWFRWGAAWTWITGVLLLGLVFAMNRSLLFEVPAPGEAPHGWGAGAGVMFALTLLAAVIYDPLAKSGLGKKNQAMAVVGLVLTAVVLWAYVNVAHFTYRAASIHLGGLYGTLMAFNVWFRIWPAQQKIITAVKSGQAPDAALVAMAGARSRHNTYMSVPLIWLMINQHTVTFSSQHGAGFPVWTLGVVAVGWWVVMLFYKKAAAVKGF